MSGTRRLLIGAAGLLLAAALVVYVSIVQVQLSDSVDFSRVAYVGSSACAECHEDRHACWHRTWRRTMTQSASADSVRGRFDGIELKAFGGRVRPLRLDSELRYDTEVAELGIGCEACHGPGGEHLARMQRFDLRWISTLLADRPGDRTRAQYRRHCGAVRLDRQIGLAAPGRGRPGRPRSMPIASSIQRCVPVCPNSAAVATSRSTS